MKDYSDPSENPLPTKALPGTICKQIVLQKRAKLGLALHHKDDARFNDEINFAIGKRMSQLKEDFPSETKVVLYKKATEEVSLYLCEEEVSLKEYEVFLSGIF